MNTTLSAAKSLVKAAGYTFRVDRTKAGHSLKVIRHGALVVPVLEDEMPAELLSHLAAIADGCKWHEYIENGCKTGAYFPRFHFYN